MMCLKRGLRLFLTLRLILIHYLRVDYIPQGYNASSDGMKKLDTDVKDANQAYNDAEQKEDEIIAQFARFKGIKAGVIPSNSDDDEMLALSEDEFQEMVDKASKKRRKLRTQLSKRIKTRDKAAELKNDTVEKREGQIYFDGTVYTARWSCLPR